LKKIFENQKNPLYPTVKDKRLAAGQLAGSGQSALTTAGAVAHRCDQTFRSWTFHANQSINQSSNLLSATKWHRPQRGLPGTVKNRQPVVDDCDR